MVLVILAHLLGEAWHVQDLLLYGGAGLGLASGVALFLWGRHERKAGPPSREDEPQGSHSLIRQN